MQAPLILRKGSTGEILSPRAQINEFVEIFFRAIDKTLADETRTVNFKNPYRGQGFYSFWLVGRSGTVYASQGKEGPIKWLSEKVAKISKSYLSEITAKEISETFYLLRIASPFTETKLNKHFTVEMYSEKYPKYPYMGEIEARLNEEAKKSELIGEGNPLEFTRWTYGRWYDVCIKRNQIKAKEVVHKLRENMVSTLEKDTNLRKNHGDPYQGQGVIFEILVSHGGELLATSGPRHECIWLVKVAVQTPVSLLDIHPSLFHEMTYVLKVEIPEASSKLSKHFTVSMASSEVKACPFLQEIEQELNSQSRSAEDLGAKIYPKKAQDDQWIYGRWFDVFKIPEIKLK